VQLNVRELVKRLFLRTEIFAMLRSLPIFIMLALAPNRSGKADHALTPSAAALHGVDISHHQKIIEWDVLLEKEPVDFAFVKATEGGDYVDSLFCRNWAALHRLGIRRGAYHFFRAYGCGLDQANHFLNLVVMQPGDIAPVLDLEVTDGIDADVWVEEARIWLQIVEQTLGVKPIIYSNLHFFERYLAGKFDGYPIWIARYSDEKPTLSNGHDWDIWQYSNEGCIEGISKKVDLNVFPGTTAMFDRLCWYPAEPVSKHPAAIALP